MSLALVFWDPELCRSLGIGRLGAAVGLGAAGGSGSSGGLGDRLGVFNRGVQAGGVKIAGCR